AEELATKLQQHVSNQASAARAAGGGAAQAGGGGGANNLDGVSVWADTQTNALVVNAPPKMMRSLMAIVDKLDIRRAQVLVEAIVAEILADRVNELGVTWAVEAAGSDAPIALTNFPSFGSGVVQLGAAVEAGGDGGTGDLTGLIGDGISIGVGRITDDGVSFAAILRALEGDADTNIISRPSILTTDNEEANLDVGQEVPFVSGSFTNTGGQGGAVNPFQTVQRESVGVKLTITPQINKGDSLLLDIKQEISSIAQSSAGAVDLITNQRIIETTVIVEDGTIVVLGGLIEDTLRESDQRVPLLGSIPLMGNLFRVRRTEFVKTNLMVFIRPKILRDTMETAIETNAKYNYMRDFQMGSQGNDVQLMPSETRPLIPPLSEEDIARETTPPPQAEDAPEGDDATAPGAAEQPEG
ncbi:MAG: secretin N-terminal domain-containing protein, partial [Pseudomonadota bacterium]